MQESNELENYIHFQRINQLTKVENRLLFEHEDWWRIYVGIFGAAVSLIEAVNLLEERQSTRLGVFTSKHAQGLHGQLNEIIEEYQKKGKFDWRFSDTITVFSGGYFLNNSIQRIAIVTDRTVKALEDRFLQKSREGWIGDRIKSLISNVDIAKHIKLYKFLVKLSDAYTKAQSNKIYAKTIGTELIKYTENLPSDATLTDVLNSVEFTGQEAVVLIWNRSNLWKHLPKGTRERKQYTINLVEWACALKALEYISLLWNEGGTIALSSDT